MHCKGDYIRKGLPGPLQMQVASIVVANAIEISLHKGHYVKPHFVKQVLKGVPPPHEGKQEANSFHQGNELRQELMNLNRSTKSKKTNNFSNRKVYSTGTNEIYPSEKAGRTRNINCNTFKQEILMM